MLAVNGAQHAARSAPSTAHLRGRQGARLCVVVALPRQLARRAVAQPDVHVRQRLGGVDLEEAVQHLGGGTWRSGG
jgi:hypothetical protein